MEPDNAFLNAFLHACCEDELLKTQEAIASGRLTPDNLEEGLELATRSGHPDIVAALFDAGAQVSASTVDFLPGKDGRQHPSVIRHFLHRGLDSNSNLSNGGPLFRTYRLLTNPACARELLSRGADPNRSGPGGVPPVVRAIVGNPSTICCAKGLDPNTTSEKCGTPLHLAVRLGKPNIVKLLLDAGADPTARNTLAKAPCSYVLQFARHDGPHLSCGQVRGYNPLPEGIITASQKWLMPATLSDDEADELNGEFIAVGFCEE
ncbi:hypothetical protein CNMCM8980_007212 [Aspergillus fumigatiaffinis]|uniref:Ankyrin repeat protein n=1 Tax=Aspergillus fumigatiaffinis TaxID=340414 RepID=A0A8H4HEU5_9EURO|nr:hypothetical protein CNMCM6805_009277 [Aspergillus fumigatiaffinis]KAF4247574.1 hypothetical protein CNMCM8980_007212 [Aspergillus fumigatiaffinis]